MSEFIKDMSKLFNLSYFDLHRDKTTMPQKPVETPIFQSWEAIPTAADMREHNRKIEENKVLVARRDLETRILRYFSDSVSKMKKQNNVRFERIQMECVLQINPDSKESYKEALKIIQASLSKKGYVMVSAFTDRARMDDRDVNPASILRISIDIEDNSVIPLPNNSRPEAQITHTPLTL